MRKITPLSERTAQSFRAHVIQASGLIAVSLIVLQPLISSTSVDTPQLISLIAFCIAIPLLVCCSVTLQYEIAFRGYIKFWSNICGVFFIIGFLAVIVGIDAVLWHLSRIGGWVFIGVSLLSFWVFVRYFNEDEFHFDESRAGNQTLIDESQK